MSALQEQAVQMVSDDEGFQAFCRLNKARTEIWNYLPEGFDPDKELEEARKERYGCID